MVIVFLPGCFCGFGGIIPFFARFPGPVVLPVVSPFLEFQMDMVFDGVHHMGETALLLGNENEEKTLFREIGNGPLSGYRRWQGSESSSLKMVRSGL